MEHRPVGFKEDAIRAALGGVLLGGLRVFQCVGSTNDEALAWALKGANDLSVVISDEQTAGRGRAGRKWHTPAGVALAFSIILRPGDRDVAGPGRLAGLGAVAVAEACDRIGIETAIKWPNDILVRRRKVAGILVEVQWSGEKAEAYVLGIGINVLHGSIPAQATIAFPATSIEAELGYAPDRIKLLRAAVSALVAWRGRMHTQEFIRAWESRLAFRGEQVSLIREGETAVMGTVLGLESDGRLRMHVDGEEMQVPVGELHLNPTNDRMG